MTLEEKIRADLAADPENIAAADALARQLMMNGRAAEALEITTPRVGSTDRISLMVSHVESLRQLGRAKEALPLLERMAGLAPSDGYVQQEYAAGLIEAGRFEDAEAVLLRAQSGGFEHPMAWLLRGLALTGLHRFDEAESALRSAIGLAPDYVEAHSELARLVWRRTGSVAAACEAMDPIIAASPAQALRLVKARLLEAAGDPRGAYAQVADTGRNPALEATASQMAIAFNPDRAVEHARAALSLMPDDPGVLAIAAEANLAAGKPTDALALAERLRQVAPRNRHGVALQATAWRLLGDDRYARLVDYDGQVQAVRIDTPEGWDSLEAFLADLARTLEALHPLRIHPVGQSVRGGSQTLQRLEQSDDPVILAFFKAVDAPIRRYIESGAVGEDVFGAGGDYAIASAWSVRLQAGGLHVSHLHPWGAISSAFYVALPDAVAGEGRKGWLAFGKPGIPTAPMLASEHFVRPEPGMLVLFPSWMWHGTTPFAGEQDRLTMAFDIVPA